MKTAKASLLIATSISSVLIQLSEELERHASELEQNNVDLRQAEAALRRYAQRMEILHQIDSGIISAKSIQEVVETALKHIRRIIPCQRADVMILDDTTGETLIFAMDFDGDTTLGQGVRVPSPPNGFEGYDSRHIRVFDDFRPLQDTMPRARRLINEGLLCAMSVLLMDREGPIGVLGMFADTPGFFTAEHQEIAAEIASQLVIAIHQMRLDEALTRHAAELEQRVIDRTADLTDAKVRVEAILNNSTDGILLVHPDFNIQQTNSAFNSLFACEPDVYFGKALITLVQTDDADKVTNIFQAIAAEQQGKSIEIRALRKDGKVFDAELSLALIKDDGLVCTFRDITERKAQERQLRYQATLQENVTDAVIVADLEFRIQSWNKAAEHIYGWSAEEVVGKATVTILRNEFSSPGERERSTQQLYQQGWWQGEISQHHKDGSTRHILGSVTLVKDENGQPFGIVSVNHDVTERKVQERQLRYLASLQESVVDAVIVTDTEFHIQTWNLGAERIYGWKTDEVIGKAAPDVLQIRVSSTQNLESSSQRFKEQGFLQQETIQQRKDGSDIYILGSATLLADENGIPVGVISVNRDITERKTQERQLRYQATLQQNVSDAVIVTDMEFRIQSWNKAAERIYGWSAEEVVSKATAEVLQTEYPSTIDQAGAIQQLREQGWWQGEVIQHHKDGHLVHILGSVTVIKDENGVPFSVVSVNHDISERIRTQQALEASEQRFKLLVSSMRDYAIIMLGVDGNITSWNPGAELIKGYTAEEVIGRHISLFYTPEDIATGEWQRALKIAESEGHFVGEGWRVRKGGSLFWASLVITALRDSTGQLIGFTKVTRDLTERKQAEVALNAKIKEEREFQDYLKALNEITIELTQIDELDVFYRRAVELGLERMGFERLGLLLYDADTQLAVGTYGTDSQGRLKAEHHIIFDPSSSTSILSRALRHDERFIVDEDTGLYSEAELIGRGWNAAVTLWKGTENLGWLAVDNAVRHVPVSKPLLDVLSLYALTLSTLLVQKRGELALRESEARYRLLAENITDVVVRTNEVGEYIYISASSRTVWGYEPEELIGQPVINFVHPDDLAVIVQAFTESMSRSAPDISQVVRFHHKQGHYIWMETIGRAIRSEKTGEIEGFISSSRDISDRKAAEEALRESEEKFRLLLDAAPVATIITDATGRITLANVQADNLFGYNRAELVGQSVDILLPDSARGRHADNRASYLAAPRVRQMGMGMELSAQRKDGSEFPVEIELSYIETRAGLLVMSFVVDITERKRVAAELERQRIFLRQVIDVSPSMIFVKDYDSRFVLVNPMVAKMYNTSVEALIGKTTADFNHAQIEVDGFLEADRRVITSGESLDIEEPVTNYSGETRWFHTVKVPIVSLDGKTKHVLGVATDITEHRKSEETLRQAFEKEKELGELKSRFVSMASHEFRTPLATILALTETLMAYRHKLLDAEIEERLIKIQNQIGHLRDIMDDVLLLARMQARRVDFNPVKINLDSLCRSVIDEFQSRPDVTQRLGYSCDEQLQEIILDKKLMRQIINNLVSNAVKYSTADSSITITLEFENDTLIFKVVDQGIGIPEADLKHLFEPFHRAENVGAISGTGLGLVITKESVELHNGTIAVESQVGIGTTFLVSIPLTK